MLTSLVLAGILQASPAPSPTPRPPVFPSEANLVHVDAIVVDKDGRQVTDLTPSDFVIEADGKKFKPTVATYVPLAVERASASESVSDENVTPRIIAFVVAQPLLLVEPRPGSELVDNRRSRLTAIHRVDA